MPVRSRLVSDEASVKATSVGGGGGGGENVVTVSMTTSDISGLLIIERFEEYC